MTEALNDRGLTSRTSAPIDQVNLRADASPAGGLVDITDPKNREIYRSIARGPVESSDLPRLIVVAPRMQTQPTNDAELPSTEISAIARGGRAQPATRRDQPGGRSCPRNPDYEKVIETAWNNMYDPSKLGDLTALRRRFNCQLKADPNLVKFANRALGVADDPYTKLLSSQETEEYHDESNGTRRGFGLTFDSEKGKRSANLPSPLFISDLVKGGPAESADIKRGDYIVAIDGISLKGKSYDVAFDMITSDKPQKFTVERNGRQHEVTLAPGEMEVPAVTDKRLDGNIAYIRIENWDQADTAEELKQALEKHADADGYILDLRDNSGGFFDQSIQAASLFVKKGTVVSTRERLAPEENDNSRRPNYERVVYELSENSLHTKTTNERTPDEQDEKTEDRLPDLVDKPTVVLVNAGSASATEVFTGALKENGEAIVIGTRTFGKGIGQSIIEGMPGNTTLKVTNFRYFTPKGNWIGDGHRLRHGIGPDIVVRNRDGVEIGAPNDTQLNMAVSEIKKRISK